jgi:hypothetical protein
MNTKKFMVVNIQVAERHVDAFDNVATQGNTLMLSANLMNMGGLPCRR